MNRSANSSSVLGIHAWPDQLAYTIKNIRNNKTGLPYLFNLLKGLENNHDYALALPSPLDRNALQETSIVSLN